MSPDDKEAIDGTVDGLTDAQLQALRLQLTGQYSFTEIAGAVGKDESTIYRWRHQPAYQAELDRRRELRDQRVVEGLHQLAVLSVEELGREIRRGELDPAVELLKGLGYLDGTRRVLGPTDPDEIRLRQERENIEKLIAEIDHERLEEEVAETLAEAVASKENGDGSQ